MTLRVRCPVCLRHVLVNNDGLRRKHTTTRGEPCRGSGQPADPWPKP
jgi:hypothetical protein